MNELLSRVMQTLVISQSCFVLGISAVILKLYIGDHRIRHIAFVAVSYILLTILVAAAIAEHLRLWISWKMVTASLAFGFGDYALLKILWFKTEKEKL